MLSQETQLQTAIESLVQQEKVQLPKILLLVIAGTAISLSLLHLGTAAFCSMDLYFQTQFVLTLLVVLCFLLHPLGRKSWGDKLNWWFVVDLLLILVTVGSLVRVVLDFERIHFGSAMPTRLDLVFGVVQILMLLEATRRAMGWPLVIVAAVLILLSMSGPNLPGILRGPPLPLKVIIGTLYMSDRGIFGLALNVFTRYLAFFMLFLAFLRATGAAEIFLNLASSIAGRWSGGPGKVCVSASGMVGTVIGSDLANIAAVGTITIPMMKKMGFKSELAGAVEAISSNGSQLMPPIMGMTAFLMAEFLGVSYFNIILAGTIPAVLYYGAIFAAVHFEAKKLGLGGLTREECPAFFPSLANAWVVLLPLGLLVFLVATGYGIATAGLYALVLLLVFSFIRKKTRMGAGSIVAALEEGGRSMVGIGLACACVGIIIGCFELTGIGDSLSRWAVSLSSEHLLFALPICALIAMILGMGVPTVMVFILMYMLAIPILIQLGIDPLAASFFAFYFGLLANVTPPVAMAAIISSNIAQSGFLRTALLAFRLGVPAYIIAFLIPLFPYLIGKGPAITVTFHATLGLLGTVCTAAALAGWALRKLDFWERIPLFAAGVCLLIPEMLTIVPGVTLLVGSVIWQKITPKADPVDEMFRV